MPQSLFAASLSGGTLLLWGLPSSWRGSEQRAPLGERLLTPLGPELPREAPLHGVRGPGGEQGLGDVAAGPSRLSCCFPAGAELRGCAR